MFNKENLENFREKKISAKNLSSKNKVDINILLNRVRADKKRENIETTLQEAFRISKHASLEIAYFMIRFSRTREKGCLVIKYLEKYKEILYQINPPTESNVSYDMELYHYR